MNFDDKDDVWKMNERLFNQLEDKRKEVEDLKSIIKENNVLIDRLQSFIPDKGNWRLFFTHSSN